MTYLIKIVYLFLFPPGIYILVLFALTAYFIHKKKIILSILLALVSIFSYLSTCTFLGYAMINALENEYAFPDSIAGDSIVVLGEGTSPGPTVDGPGELTGDLALNVIAALKLYNRLQVPIIVSGGSSLNARNEQNEAQLSKRDLLQMQVPEDMIITEDRSRTTQENAQFTAAILKQRGLTSPILVTTAPHIPRSVALFQQEGVSVLAVPTRYTPPQNVQYNLFDFLPSPSGVFMVQQGLKEALGQMQLIF
ncbi:YdcF family protein [Paenibacillus ferrarius]|uniref:YdcF family protein n=1 Tax=Paenibacillus ferrarius TaxID=1469647 RepID=UPI003D28E554